MNAEKMLKAFLCGKLSEAELRAEMSRQAGKMAQRKEAVKMLLDSIPGEYSKREGLVETPDRVARMYDEIFGGYEMNPLEVLNKTFTVDKAEQVRAGDIYQSGIVVVKDISFYSHCEHHMVPFIGRAWVAYIPTDKVVGLSKIARVVEGFARRLQIQERMTTQIADALEEALQPQGVMVVIEAEHLCMAMRGVKKPGTNTVTSSVRGVFAENDAARAECLNLFGLQK